MSLLYFFSNLCIYFYGPIELFWSALFIVIIIIIFRTFMIESLKLEILCVLMNFSFLAGQLLLLLLLLLYESEEKAKQD